MTLRRRLIDWGLAALLLLVPAVVLRSSLKQPEETSTVDQAILRVSAPLQAAVSWLVDLIGSGWSHYVALVDVEAENRELRAENETLRKELAAATRRAIDIEALEQMLDLEARVTADTIGARVIGTSLSPQYRVVRIRIDRGDTQVGVGMPVIANAGTSVGLVGRVVRVYDRHAEVMLVTDGDSSVPVMVSRTGATGSLTGAGEDDRYACKIEVLRSEGNAAVEEGDILVTSGLGDFPAGLEVGVVSRVTDRDTHMFYEVDVEPSVDFSRLAGVTVLLAPPPPPDPDAEEERRSESAFGVRPK